MKRALALCLLTISAPCLAVAQDVSGAVTLGFGDHNVSDIDQGLSTASLDGRINLTFANGMTLGVNAGYLDLGIDGVPVDITATFVGLDVGYKMASGLSFGVYAEQLTGQISLAPIDLSLKSIGAEVGYETGKLDLGAFVGRTSVSPDIADIEADTLGLSAKYAAMPNLTLGGSFQRASISAGGGEADVDLFGLAGAYDINDQFSAFGGISRTTIDGLDADITTMGLGLGYNLDLGGVASTVSLELARTDLSALGGETDLDTIRLGITLPLGGGGTETPLNSVADSIFNPRHGAVNAALTGAF
jgi:predicted porin